MEIVALLEAVGKSFLILFGIQLLGGLLGGFGVLCGMLGWGMVQGFREHIRELSAGDRLSHILMIGPIEAAFAFVSFGLAILSFLTIPSLYFAWLGTPPFIMSAVAWSESPAVASLTTHLSIILLGLFFSVFTLGVSFTCLRGIPSMLRTMSAFGDFVAVLFAFGLGVAFLFGSIMLFTTLVTRTF